MNEIINNVKIYGLQDSFKASKYPMSTNTDVTSAHRTSDKIVKVEE